MKYVQKSTDAIALRSLKSTSDDDGCLLQVRLRVPKNTTTLPNNDRRRFETRIWLQILSLESTIFSSLNGALSADFGLSVAKFEFLAQLERYPDGISLGQISSNLKVSRGNVSGLVRRLQDDGLITKEMSPDDRRSFIVRFSPKGKDVFEKACIIHAEKLAECFEDIPLNDLELSLAALKSLYSRIQWSPK